MNSRSIICGVGLITVQGLTAAVTWDAILAGNYLTDQARVPLPTNGEPRVTQLGRIAAAEALFAAGWLPESMSARRTALIVGTSKGPIEEWLPGRGGEVEFLRRGGPADGSFSPALGLSSTAAELAAAFHFRSGPRLTISAACASGLCALIRADMLLRERKADSVLVIGVESALHDLFVGSFTRLGVLAPTGYGCRPFDVNRRGFHLSEAAAAVCLKRSKPSAADVYVDGWALGGDATHLTGLDPTGGAMESVLRRALAGRPVDLIHAHGTATQQNDAAELTALSAALPNADIAQWPHLFSHKAALGHTQGAAGLIGVVLNVLAHRSEIVPPNAATSCPVSTDRVRLSNALVEKPIHRSLIQAAGFGGPVAAVTLQSQ